MKYYIVFICMPAVWYYDNYVEENSSWLLLIRKEKNKKKSVRTSGNVETKLTRVLLMIDVELHHM